MLWCPYTTHERFYFVEDTMFADFSPDSDWSNHSHRGWTTLISFALQAVAVGSLLLLPLFYTEGLPRLAMLAPLLTPAPPPAAPPTPRPNSPATPQSNMVGNRIGSPAQIPPTVAILTDTEPPPPVIDPGTLGVHDGTGDPNARGSVLNSVLGSDLAVPPPPPPAMHHPPVSRMMEGNLIDRVQPDYPPLARQVRVQGLVVLRAMISRDGAIEDLQVLSGHPMLVKAAVEAVRQWRYRPYELNGEPVEVETEVKVNFVLSGG
jgi:periplasmic protein TonB